MTMARPGLPQRFAAFFEMRTRNGIVNRLPQYETDYESSTDYTLLCGLFEAVRTNQRDQYRIRPDPQMGSRLFHDGQLTRSSTDLFDYGTAVGLISPRNENHASVRRNMRFALTPYSVYISTNDHEMFPVVLFDFRTTEALMDTSGPSSRTSMPSMNWIQNLLLERRNLVEDTNIYDNNIINDDMNLFPPTRHRNDSWPQSRGGGGGGAAAGAAGPYGAGGYGVYSPQQYHQPYPNINTYYNFPIPSDSIPISLSGGGAAGGGAGSGAAAGGAYVRGTEQEGSGGRPLETFVAEALLREAIRTHMTCAISMEPVENRGCVVTNCFHIFQQEALEQWAESHSNCPVCRAALVYRPVSVSLPQ